MKFLTEIDMEQNKVTDLGAPSADSDAATKGYVDSVAAGLDPKNSCRAATTANITIATALNNGDSLDGVTLATADRVLVKDQSSSAENGIYVVGPSPARSTDADASGELSGGSYVFVEEGTVNADTGWVITTNGNIIPGTTAHTWTQFTGAGAIIAGNGLTKSGNTLDVNTGDGTTITSDAVVVDSTVARRNAANTFTAAQTIDLAGAGNALTLDIHDNGASWLFFTEQGVTRGGIMEAGNTVQLQASGAVGVVANAGAVTLQSTGGDIVLDSGADISAGNNKITSLSNASAGGDALNRDSGDARYARKYAVQIGDNSDVSITVNHALNTRDVDVRVYRNSSPYDEVECDVEHTDANNVECKFAVAPTTNQYKAVVHG